MLRNGLFKYSTLCLTYEVHGPITRTCGVSYMRRAVVKELKLSSEDTTNRLVKLKG